MLSGLHGKWEFPSSGKSIKDESTVLSHLRHGHFILIKSSYLVGKMNNFRNLCWIVDLDSIKNFVGIEENLNRVAGLLFLIGMCLKASSKIILVFMDPKIFQSFSKP